MQNTNFIYSTVSKLGSVCVRVCVCVVKEVLEFVEGSEHGIVVFTLGSLVPAMPKEKATIFLQAFSRIPQRVSVHTHTNTRAHIHYLYTTYYLCVLVIGRVIISHRCSNLKVNDAIVPI